MDCLPFGVRVEIIGDSRDVRSGGLLVYGWRDSRRCVRVKGKVD